tara:strand:- start:1446 stop:1841 length:396 start_codon:yes stop_codon:yes gene_type:complete
MVYLKVLSYLLYAISIILISLGALDGNFEINKLTFTDNIPIALLLLWYSHLMVVFELNSRKVLSKLIFTAALALNSILALYICTIGLIDGGLGEGMVIVLPFAIYLPMFITILILVLGLVYALITKLKRKV